MGKRRLAGRPALVLLYIAGPALLLGGAYLARLRSDLADRADYEVARRQCGASGGQGADTPAARFWCRRERQLYAALGYATAERLGAEAGAVELAAGRPSTAAGSPAGQAAAEGGASRASVTTGALSVAAGEGGTGGAAVAPDPVTIVYRSLPVDSPAPIGVVPLSRPVPWPIEPSSPAVAGTTRPRPVDGNRGGAASSLPAGPGPATTAISAEEPDAPGTRGGAGPGATAEAAARPDPGGPTSGERLTAPGEPAREVPGPVQAAAGPEPSGDGRGATDGPAAASRAAGALQADVPADSVQGDVDAAVARKLAGLPLARRRTAAASGPVEPPAEVPEAGRFGIQLASVRDPAGARALWRRLTARHRDLSGMTLRVRRADDPAGQGSVYRVVAAGFGGEDRARAACDRLRAEGQGCVVVRQ